MQYVLEQCGFDSTMQVYEFWTRRTAWVVAEVYEAIDQVVVDLWLPNDLMLSQQEQKNISNVIDEVLSEEIDMQQQKHHHQQDHYQQKHQHPQQHVGFPWRDFQHADISLWTKELGSKERESLEQDRPPRLFFLESPKHSFKYDRMLIECIENGSHYAVNQLLLQGMFFTEQASTWLTTTSGPKVFLDRILGDSFPYPTWLTFMMLLVRKTGTPLPTQYNKREKEGLGEEVTRCQPGSGYSQVIYFCERPCTLPHRLAFYLHSIMHHEIRLNLFDVLVRDDEICNVPIRRGLQTPHSVPPSPQRKLVYDRMHHDTTKQVLLEVCKKLRGL